MQLSQKVREYLAVNDPEFRPLMEQHKQFEEELDKLSHKAGLNAAEQVRMAEVKKKKLNLKDQMFLIAKRHEKELQGLD
jgi:uncharacterized protein YdcH (DUF465 family)